MLSGDPDSPGSVAMATEELSLVVGYFDENMILDEDLDLK
jgi:hypothetical protein